MNFNKALSKCMYICSQREYCVYDIETKLTKWEVLVDDKNKVIDTLLDDKYIDHDRYVPAFINDKFTFNRWGKVKIKYYLKQKRIDDSIINKFISTIDELAYEKVLVDEINKKRKSIKGEDKFEINQKVARYVISKGFEPEKVFEKLNK